jgi:tyrosinase
MSETSHLLQKRKEIEHSNQHGWNPRTSLTSDEKDAYIAADLCLINAPSKLGIEGAVTRWDDLQWPHVVQSATVHDVGAFLPFHRYYMTAHERLIKDECGYTGRMPYVIFFL